MPRHLIDWFRVEDYVWESQVEAARRHRREGAVWTDAARGRSLALLFFNPSLRTRTSMELAAAQLGAHVTTLVAVHPATVGPGEGRMDGPEAEHIREAVGVLSRYYDALGVRLFASLANYAQDRDETLLQTFADAATVPVVNLESAFYHPCQALADAATLMEHFGGQTEGKRLVLSWAYHPKALPMAVPNSALLMAARLGLNVVVARPEGYALDADVMERARRYAARRGASVEETDVQETAFDGADVIYAKAWGGPLVYTDAEHEAARRAGLTGWRVTPSLMQRTREAAFMHCLPVRRNVVVDDAVLDGPRAIHLLQAEYRLHAQKAILEWLWDL